MENQSKDGIKKNSLKEIRNMNPINIVCATDNKYVPYCGVMLTSLFENNKEREVNVYIMIDNPLPEIETEQLSRLEKQYGKHIHFCTVDSSFFDKYPIRKKDKMHLSVVTYYRLLAEELLPQEVKQVLYLDCDIIVDGAIGELFDMDWTDIAIGAVPDMCTEWDAYYNRLGYEKSLGYFNAGVALMNLDYWRKHHIAKQCFEYLVNNYEKLDNNDQDVLNVAMKDLKRNLPVTYNYQIQLRMPYFFNTFSRKMQEDIRKTQHPLIIHYASELKPWMAYYYAYPFYRTWHKYKKLSPWRCMRDQLPKTRKFVAWVKRYMIWPMGLWLKKPELIKE